MKKEMNSSLMSTIVLLPVVMLLSILKLRGLLTDVISSYILAIISFIFVVEFIMSLFFILDEIIYSDNKKRICYLVLFPFFYLPIYYFKYVSNKEKIMGYMTLVMNVVVIGCFFIASQKAINNYVNENYNLALNNREIVLK